MSIYIEAVFNSSSCWGKAVCVFRSVLMMEKGKQTETENKQTPG